jgi:site-specific DNA-methyltransferase (cytosine-N4-specific)
MRDLGFPAHGAPMPLALAEFLIKLATVPGETVADPFGGSFTTAKAAERLGRKWLSTECMAQYVIGGATRFEDYPGFNQFLVA